MKRACSAASSGVDEAGVDEAGVDEAGVDEAGAGSGACAAGWGVVVSIASQGSRARGRREKMGRTDTHTEGNASRATLFHNHNMCALHHFWPVVWEGRGSSASPGGKGIEQ